jgi:hypothetical protein
MTSYLTRQVREFPYGQFLHRKVGMVRVVFLLSMTHLGKEFYEPLCGGKDGQETGGQEKVRVRCHFQGLSISFS